ncbi:phage tail protein [Rhizobium sp. DKSPLA3]|uniref:Phage tail protein n=1 Tax=Rhizobium quercicola TaxID=2901226 RepID=A0A9X1T7E0_9HYPH|nr:phage tail tube protein [Rhizobium quercicola]MCD7109708.1 phage tail protein [Rhizobium quercicola]
MADGQQLGRTLLIQIGDGAGTEVFTNLCGLTTRSFSMSANEIDTTIPSCTNPGGPVEGTSRPGISKKTFSGSGRYVSSAAQKAFNTKIVGAEVFNAKIIVPGVGTFSGPYFVTDYELSGDVENSMEFTASFVPAAPPVFVAEA